MTSLNGSLPLNQSNSVQLGYSRSNIGNSGNITSPTKSPITSIAISKISSQLDLDEKKDDRDTIKPTAIKAVKEDSKYFRRGVNFGVLNNGTFINSDKDFEEVDVEPPHVAAQRFVLNTSILQSDKIYGLFFAINKDPAKCVVDQSEVIFISLKKLLKQWHIGSQYYRFISKSSSQFWVEKSLESKYGLNSIVNYQNGDDTRVNVCVYLHPASEFRIVCPTGLHFKYDIFEVNKETTKALHQICSFDSSSGSLVEHDAPRQHQHLDGLGVMLDNIDRVASFELDKEEYAAKIMYKGPRLLSPPNDVFLPFPEQKLTWFKIYGLFLSFIKIGGKASIPEFNKDDYFLIRKVNEKGNPTKTPFFQYFFKSGQTVWLKSAKENLILGSKIVTKFPISTEATIHSPQGYSIQYELWEMHSQQLDKRKRFICSSAEKGRKISQMKEDIVEIVEKKAAPSSNEMDSKLQAMGVQSISLPIKVIENRIGYIFKNKDLLIQAFTDIGKIHLNPEHKSNAVMELYGDAIANVLAAELITRHFTVIYKPERQGRGVFNLWASQYLVGNALFTNLFIDAHLDIYIKLGLDSIPAKKFANYIEALLAATFMDGNSIEDIRDLFNQLLGKRKQEFITEAQSNTSVKYHKNVFELLIDLSTKLQKIAEKDLLPIEKKLEPIRKEFRNPSLLTFAVADPSYLKEKGLSDEIPGIYLLGLAFVKFFVIKYLLTKYPDEDKDFLKGKMEGFSSKRAADENLKKLNLHDSYLTVEIQENQSDIFYHRLLGTIYLDRGIAAAEEFFLRTFHWDPNNQIALEKTKIRAKSKRPPAQFRDLTAAINEPTFE